MTQSNAAVNTDALRFGRLRSLLSFGCLDRPVFGQLTDSPTKNTEVILSLEENKHIKLPAEPINVS
jgi:hypothetical protein